MTGRPGKIVAEEIKVEMCNLYANKNMRAKKISKLEKFKEIGYNKIGRIIKQECPGILARISGGVTPPAALINPSSSIQSNQTNNGPSNQWPLNGGRFMLTSPNSTSFTLGSDFSPEVLDSDSDDYDLDPYLGYYSPIQPIQTSMLGPTDLLNGLVNGVNTTFNSRMHSLIADWADRVTRPLFPNLFPNQREKTASEKLSEIIDKLKKKEANSTERELNAADDSIEETGSCSCLDDERDSKDASEQKSTGNTDNPSVDRMIVKEVNPSEPPPEKAISDESSVDTPTTELGGTPPQLEKPKEEQNTPTQQSASGKLNQPPLVPPPPPPSSASDIASSGTNSRLDTLITPAPAGTEKLKTPLVGENGSSSTTQNQEQKPTGQNSVGIGTITDQCQLPIAAQIPVMVENVQEKPKAPPFKPVDNASEGQLPGTFVGASGPVDPSTDNHHSLIQGPGSKGTDPPDGKKKERLDSLGQAGGGKTDTNQQNFDPSDLIVPGTLIGLGLLLVAGVVKSCSEQNKNRQPESRTEVDKNVDSNLAVNEEKKPPPTLYSIQPQGEAAGTRIF